MVRCLTCNVFYMQQFCRFYYCLAWFDTVEFNRLLCPDNEMYDNAVFADRFRYQLTTFEIRILIWLSRLLRTHIAYEIDTSNIIAAFCRISYCLHDLIRLNSIVRHVQTTICTMMWVSMIDSDINWLCMKCAYWFLHTHIACEIAIWKITTGNWHDSWNDLSCRTVVKR